MKLYTRSGDGALATIGLALILALASTGVATGQSFQASNVQVTDFIGDAGRSYAGAVQYWATTGEEAILYTVPFSSSSSFLILEDFASGLRYVACDQGCQLESLSGVTFPQLDATTAASTRFPYGSFDRSFDLPSGGLLTLSARPTIPAICTASSSLALTTDPCLPFGLPCGSSCLCLGCTDGDNCTANDACGLSSLGVLTCTGTEVCNRTLSNAKTAIVLRHRGGGGSGTAVALGVALGVGIGVPVGVCLLFSFCVLPLILLPLLWRRRERRPTVVQTTAVPVGAAAVATPVAVGNPLYAEPWRTTAVPQGMVAVQQQPTVLMTPVGTDIPVYPGPSAGVTRTGF